MARITLIVFIVPRYSGSYILNPLFNAQVASFFFKLRDNAALQRPNPHALENSSWECFIAALMRFRANRLLFEVDSVTAYRRLNCTRVKSNLHSQTLEAFLLYH